MSIAHAWSLPSALLDITVVGPWVSTSILNGSIRSRKTLESQRHSELIIEVVRWFPTFPPKRGSTSFLEIPASQLSQVSQFSVSR